MPLKWLIIVNYLIRFKFQWSLSINIWSLIRVLQDSNIPYSPDASNYGTQEVVLELDVNIHDVQTHIIYYTYRKYYVRKLK